MHRRPLILILMLAIVLNLSWVGVELPSMIERTSGAGLSGLYQNLSIQLAHIFCALELYCLWFASPALIGRGSRVLLAVLCLLYLASTLLLISFPWNAFSSGAAGLIGLFVWVPSGLGLLLVLLVSALKAL